MSYQWTFEIKDVVKFSETTITVYGLTIDECYKKIRELRIPYLRKIADIEEYLILKEVIEVSIDVYIEDDDPTETTLA